MPDLEPIIVLPAQRGEYARKKGGGKTPAPIVTVDRQLRSGLVTQLSSVRQIAAADRPGAVQGTPVAIRVRDEALAKSNRPYEFLADADLMPVAGGARGEMISRATPENTNALAELIATRTSKRDTFAISTFESFRVFDPVSDAAASAEFSSAQSLLDAARAHSTPLRVELFPWLSLQSLWQDGQTLGQYLELVGLPVMSTAGSRTRTALYLQVTDDATVQSLQTLIGIRSAVLAPAYNAPAPVGPQSFRVVAGPGEVQVPDPVDIDAMVGILDSGIEHGALDAWIRRRWAYEVPPDSDTTHGTFVGGLVVASRQLNDDSEDFPLDPALLFDAQVLPAGKVSEDVLIDRITEVLNESGPTGPRIWNCSFNNEEHMDPIAYGTLSQELDLLSDTHGVLFVQSAGNFPGLRRTWPPDGSPGKEDGLAVPAEAVRSLTVGSLSHLGGLTPRGAVASYSRRGPSFGGQQKPEVTYWSGDFDESEQLSGYGVQSLGPGDFKLEMVGTSFATPIVSSIAANIWSDLLVGGAVESIAPELVKGLVVHSATVANMAISDEQRPYYGAGRPHGESVVLFDRPNAFTSIHEVELVSGVNWEKRPFPLPECLIDAAGKMKATVALTISYAPVIDPAFGEECTRTCVESSFGRYTMKNGKETFKGKMGDSQSWEKDLIDRGKWSPIKTYRKKWGGVDAYGDWALKLRLTARDSTIEPLTQRVFVIVTLESPDETLPVHNDGLAAVAALRYPSALAIDVGRLRVRT